MTIKSLQPLFSEIIFLAQQIETLPAATVVTLGEMVLEWD